MGEDGEAALRARVEMRFDALAKVFDGAGSGRGVVIAAGGARLFVNAYLLAHVLRRRLGCATPIEVWHYGGGELSPRMRALLADLGVATVDAAPLIARAGVTIRDGWQLKPFALVACRFAEVLLLDADQVPVVDPCVAFEWPQYREAGAVFWPDVLDIKAENPIWAALGVAGERSVSLESGQVMVDKRRHMRAALATLALNEAAETTYRYLYGDKDTFLVAWRLLDASFAMAPHRPFVEERSLVQRDFNGAAFLQHRTNCKWTYSGEQYAPKAAVHQEACLAALAELRTLWNGRIFNPPPRSAAARRVEAWLIGALRLRCEIVGEDRFALEFWPDGELGEGRSQDRANWSVEDDPASVSGFALTIWGRRAAGVPPPPSGRRNLARREVSFSHGAGRRRPGARCGAAAPVPGVRRGLVDDFLAAAESPAETDDAELRGALDSAVAFRSRRRRAAAASGARRGDRAPTRRSARGAGRDGRGSAPAVAGGCIRNFSKSRTAMCASPNCRIAAIDRVRRRDGAARCAA